MSYSIRFAGKIRGKPSHNVKNLLRSAIECQRAGNLHQAEQLYNEILKYQPRNAEVYCRLGNILQDSGKIDEAIGSYRKAIRINPDSAGAYYDLASIFHEKGQLDQAATYYKKCLQRNPAFAGTYNSLGVISQKKKKYDEAAAYFDHALRLDPSFDQPYNNLGLISYEKKQFDEAIKYFQKSLQLNPNYAKAYFNLGNALQEKTQLDEAIKCYYKVIELTPQFVEVYNRLGTALVEKGESDKAIECYRRALSLNPDSVDPYISLGVIFKDRGNYEEAEKCFRQSLKIMPDCSACYSNLLFLMLYSTKYDSQGIFSEHLKFAEYCAESFISSVRGHDHDNDKSPGRRLKIGYVSRDFRCHSVAFFFEPIIEAHSRKHFEIFCYSDVTKHDKVTERIKARANKWRNLAGVSDDQAAKLIRKDKIDILIDLAGLTSPRVLLFARKPAPIQITWIGYPATTGLSTMDYKIVDSYTDPGGMTEQFYTEKLIRMPEGFLCYLPYENSPMVGSLPVLKSTRITFGSFNNFAKLSPDVFSLWSKILKAVPESNLMIKAWSLRDRSVCQSALDIFAKEGIRTERISLLPHEPSLEGHLNSYNRVDIALDTFPYNGTTTTCEAVWMGVPVITLAGNSHVSRVGMSLLSNIGLPELVATSHDEYVAMAVNLADDVKKLKSMRGSLRSIMQNSPLMDSHRFTIKLETCYRAVWETWCRTA